MKERYKNNVGTLISEENQEQLLKMDFAVLGCGGQGGYIIDFLCRLGVHKIVIFGSRRYLIKILKINRK